MAESGLYLGESLSEGRARTGETINIDPAELTTHGVVLGMTGSGKTGLGVVLLEEVLRRGIPAIILDPKGDLGNLLLTFDEMTGERFEPWVDATEASQKGVDTRTMATQVAERWRSGLKDWGLGTEDISGLHSSVDLQLFTPGSSVGNPVSLLGGLDAPEADWELQGESLREEIAAWVSGLLGMIGQDADPLTSREHILLANLIEGAWRAGHAMDMATLLSQVHRPPIRKLGVFDVDTFFPENDRFKLVMRLNALMASPSFDAWMQGPPLDIDELLGTGTKPRGAVLSLAHLSEAERQFVVTMVLSKAVSWMRKQPGTGQLRGLIYVDEAFGYAPPTAKPPSKQPLLTLLKQARAHGLGVVLATQNPIDLDYKVMSNAGTWFIGRLQTQRDKARILEALQTSSGHTDTAEIDALVGSLGKREFLLWSTRRDTPVLFSSRWTMSYLRGPLSRGEIGRLKHAPEEHSSKSKGHQPAPEFTPKIAKSPTPPHARGHTSHRELGPNETRVLPALPEHIEQFWLDPAAPFANELGLDPRSNRWEAALAVRVHLNYRDAKADLNHVEEWECFWLDLGDFDASRGIEVDYDKRDLRSVAPADPVYVVPSAPIHTKTWWKRTQSELRGWLRRSSEIEIFFNRPLKLYSRVGESRESFEARCGKSAADHADRELANLRERFERKFVTAQNRLEAAEQKLRKAEVNAQTKRQDEMISGVASIFKAFFGGGSNGKKMASGITSISRRRGVTRNADARADTARSKVEQCHEQLDDLKAELEEKVMEVQSKWEAAGLQLSVEEVEVARSGVEIDEAVLVWVPIT